MMGLIGAGNNPMVGMTAAVAVAIEDAELALRFVVSNSDVSVVIRQMLKKATRTMGK